MLLTTRGLGKRGGLLATAGLGRRLVLAVDGETETHDRFNTQRGQILREDEELVMIGHGLVQLCNRLH